MLKTTLRPALTSRLSNGSSFRTLASAATANAKKEGDISNSFASLAGTDNAVLPDRYTSIKHSLISGHEDAVLSSFQRLLRALRTSIPTIKSHGSATIPSIPFSEISNPPASFTAAHRATGVAIIRSVVPPTDALSWLSDLRAYIAANPTTKGFPADRPAVYELYWSRAQVLARSHPNMLETFRFLMSHWHNASSPALQGGSSNHLHTAAPISMSHPISYADRLRIRPPGDTSFALGPHVDGGSVERWEPSGYNGLSGPYSSVFQGNWDEHDPFEASSRLGVTSDLYSGAGACSMFRMYQGWLSLSSTGPGEGTLKVNPLFKLATAYYLLRPFFVPLNPDPARPGFLDEGNWMLEPEGSSKIEGAWPGHGQELSASLHPHLELADTMVSVGQVEPGDYIAWHCDTIHAVDAEHKGTGDASVLYIPAAPLTEGNARYLYRQREAFLKGEPGPDFPGGEGESRHVGRATEGIFEEGGGDVEGARGMGLGMWDPSRFADVGEAEVMERANRILS